MCDARHGGSYTNRAAREKGNVAKMSAFGALDVLFWIFESQRSWKVGGGRLGPVS